MASASVPVAFPVTELRGYHLIDGGTVWNTNIASGIEKCKQLGFKDEKDVVLDVIVLLGQNMTYANIANIVCTLDINPTVSRGFNSEKVIILT